MMQTTWLALGALAVVATGASIWTDERDRGIIGGVVGFLTFLFWAYGALGVQIPDQGGGQPIELSYPVLAVFGAGLAALALASTIDHVLALLDPDEASELLRQWGRGTDGRRYD